jgi:hypothetical protein
MTNAPMPVAMVRGGYAWPRWRLPVFPQDLIATAFHALRSFDFDRPATGR